MGRVWIESLNKIEEDEKTRKYIDIDCYLYETCIKISETSTSIKDKLYEIRVDGNFIVYQYKKGDKLDFEKIKNDMVFKLFEEEKHKLKQKKQSYIEMEKGFNIAFKKQVRLEKLKRIIDE